MVIKTLMAAEQTKRDENFLKTFFYPNVQSKHARPLAYNGFGLVAVGELDALLLIAPLKLIRSTQLN